MKPYAASTVNTVLAGAATVIIVWAMRQWAHVDVPESVGQAFTAIAAALASHFTNDKPAE